MIEKGNSAVIGIIAVVIVIVATGTIVLKHQPSTNSASQSEITSLSTGTSTNTTNSDSTTSSGTTSASDTSSTSNFTNGTYRATGSYQSPSGIEQMGVTVTIKNNVITDSQVQPHASSGESYAYQNDFADSYKSLVVGKKISSVHLLKVSGSSLTTNGFNDAIDKIKAQAKA